MWTLKKCIVLLFVAFWTSVSFINQSSAQSARFIASYGDWYVYTVGTGSSMVCFMQSEPLTRLPAGVNRDPTFYMVANYASGRAKHEISVVIGYPFKGENSASSSVDGARKIEYYTKDSFAFLFTRADEAKMIEQMKAGKKMIFYGLSKRGTNTVDTYSLSGVTKALGKIDELCK